jgi:hypothetical protein
VSSCQRYFCPNRPARLPGLTGSPTKALSSRLRASIATSLCSAALWLRLIDAPATFIKAVNAIARSMIAAITSSRLKPRCADRRIIAPPHRPRAPRRSARTR